MNKKLLAIAVAGALAAPGVALAEGSSVTISGFIKQGLEQLSYSGTPADTRLNTSQMRVVDGASRVVFNSTESLGNGLSGIMQVDLRITGNVNAWVGPGGVGLDGGNTYVGLKSDSWGELSMGRRDMHYMVATIPLDNTPSVAGPLQYSPTSLIDFVGNVGSGVGSQGSAVLYKTPNWNGFSAALGYTANFADTTGDMNIPVGGVAAGVAAGTASSRKGDGWNVAPMYVNGPFGIGYSYWSNKYDAPGITTLDDRSDTLWGYYTFNGFKIGLGWNRIELTDAIAGTKAAERDAWTIPMSYTSGPHNIAGHYTVAGDIDDATGSVADSGARMFAIAYSYSFSKRTAVGLSYSKIDNDSLANYGFFTGHAQGSATEWPLAGESPRSIQATIVHSF
ncbi:MAG: porin [Pseudomonadota bacterium]